MDHNFLRATLLSHQVSSVERDRHPLHLEREMVLYKPAGAHPRRSRMTVMRRWAGARLVLLGQRLQTAPSTEPLTDPVSTQ